MFAKRRLETLAPQTFREPDGNWELASGIALGASTGVGFAVLLLAIGYYLDLDRTRLMLQTILRQI
jgi:hypothetical protein